QGDNGGRPFATRKLLHDAHGAKTAVDIVAQEHGHALVEAGWFKIGLDARGHLPQQVIATVDVADTVDPHAIRDPTLNRSRSGPFPEPLQDRIHPRHEFSPHPLGPVLTHAHSLSGPSPLRLRASAHHGAPEDAKNTGASLSRRSTTSRKTWRWHV